VIAIRSGSLELAVNLGVLGSIDGVVSTALSR
jgi:hypothetical protein